MVAFDRIARRLAGKWCGGHQAMTGGAGNALQIHGVEFAAIGAIATGAPIQPCIGRMAADAKFATTRNILIGNLQCGAEEGIARTVRHHRAGIFGDNVIDMTKGTTRRIGQRADQAAGLRAREKNIIRGNLRQQRVRLCQWWGCRQGGQ